MARSRSGLSLRRRRNKSRHLSTLDAVIYQWYAALLAAVSAGIGLGGFRQKDEKRSSRPPQRTPARMETAKATATASSTAPSTSTTVSHSARGIANTERASQPAAAVPAATAARQTNGHKTETNQVMHLALSLKRQNRLLIFLFSLLVISHLFPLTMAFENSDQIIMFNQVGQMASSMAYIHAAIPLNISTYQHHMSLFADTLIKITNTPATTKQPVIKSIKEMALFAAKRLNKLASKLRTIDNVLPNDDFSHTLNSRQKRFLDVLFLPSIEAKTHRLRNESLEGDLFDSDCNLKNLTRPPPLYFTPAKPRQGRLFGIIHDMIRQDHKKQELVRRNYLWACYLNKTKDNNPNPIPAPPSHTTELPTIDSPDYIDFHSYITNTSKTHTKRHTDVLHTNTHRQKRQIFAAIGAIGGVLGTILGLFNQHEIHNIVNHVSQLETNQNLIINVAHKNTKAIQHFGNELDHLANVVNSLIAFNPSLVYARLQAQLDDLADHLATLLDTIQQLQHQRLSIQLLDMDQLNELYAHLQTAAANNNYKLLIQNSQDIFQLDVSYVRKNSDVLILVHVPCLTDTHLLTIYRYANLPLPVSTLLQNPNANTSNLQLFTPIHTINDVLTQFSNPVTAPSQEALYLLPETDLIAIGQNDGNTHRYKLLSFADLAACIQRNHVYLCEGHQVLRTDLEGSCLGAIYLQSQRGVRENCKVERKPLRESVFQVSPTDHIVISPYAHTTQVTCKNGTHYPIRIQTTSRIHIDPGCTLKLFNHTLRSDESLRLKPEPLLWTWAFNPLTLPSETMAQAKHLDDHLNQIKTHIAALQNETVKDAEFPDQISDTLTSSISTFSVLFWTMFGLSLLGLAFLTCWYCGARRNRYTRAQLRPDELPTSISQIADLNLPDADGRRR